MQKKYFNNSIISLILIVSTMLMPFSFMPQKAQAQSVAGYATGLAPAIAALPQCKTVINSSITGLFSGISDSTAEAALGPLPTVGAIASAPSLNIAIPSTLNIGGTAIDLKAAASSAAHAITDQKVSDTVTHDLLQKVANSTATNAAADKANSDNATCIASIGKLIIKTLLQKLTVSTINWIKSGFNGGPAFVQDPSKFFGNIAKTEMLQMGVEVTASGNPFGKAWLQNTAAAYNKKFQDNATYSLDQLIQQTTPQYSGIKFKDDFSQGGWNAWTALTQVPANNPLGAQLMFDNELSLRLAGTNQSTAQQAQNALNQAQGFLGDYRCTNPTTVTQQDKNAALKAGKPDPCTGGWQYVTPGSMVAYEAQNVMGYQSTSYFNVQDLNDAVAAITDALLSQFSSNIMTNGFANTSNQGADGTLYNTEQVGSGVTNQTQTEQDFQSSQLASSSWLQANPNFDIRTDLTQALIDTQRTYSDKLALQDKELNSTTDGQPYQMNDCPTGWSGTYPTCTATPNVYTCPDGWTGTYPTCTAPVESCPDGWSGTYPVCSPIASANIYACPNGWGGTYPGQCTAPTETCPTGWTGTYPTCTAALVTEICPTGWTQNGTQTDTTGTYPTCTAPKNSVSGVSNAYGLMPVIYQLDYCIPGPHPGWENDSRTTLTNIIIPSDQPQTENTADVVAESVVSAGLNFVPYVGPVLSSIFGGLLGESAAEKASTNTRQHYADEFEKLTYYHLRTRYNVATDLVDVNMSSADGLMQSLNTILNRYINIMNGTYFSSPDYLPPVANEAATDFNQLTGYAQMIQDNQNKILSLKTTVSTLQDIKNAVDKLNTEHDNGTVPDSSGHTGSDQNAAYNFQLQTQIDAFGRVSEDMVTGDDIANADSIYKQIIDEKNYIYKNLLKGPYGCEAWLSNSDNIKNFPPTPTATGQAVGESTYDWSNFNVNSVERMTYPFPILYDYNVIPAGGAIPDPWNSGEPQTTMPKTNGYDTYGPGFLSFVFFSNNTGGCGGGGSQEGAERLQIGDLVDTNCSETAGSTHVPVGMSTAVKNRLSNSDHVFEQTIGIY